MRLLLTLADRLIGLDRDAEAIQAYEDLLKQDPAYPDKSAIYRKLLPLTQKLNRTNEVEKIQGLLKSAEPAAPAATPPSSQR